MSQPNIVLHVADVHKRFGGLHALADVDLQIEEGKTHAIIGPNGAGKSTLLNVIIGKLAPTSGQVVFDGTVLTGRKPHEINQLGIARVFQTPEIFPDLSVLHNVMIPALAKRDGAFKLSMLRSLESETSVRAEAEHMLEDVGMLGRRESPAGSLSRGDKRRMELAMCLIQRPRLLLLDEPTAGMSRHDTNTTIDLLQKIKSRGTTKVIIEHDMHVVFSLADKISVLAQGRIIAEGTPDQVRGNPKVQEAYLGGAH
ncbi:ABC transporter ATP-binding protein [Devosia sp. RR2S18]|jgi:branched-chain amino acid transport system ATP-binding protein|uniref:ABC transporter ATP-binding protein n=1 Tax=Devosia rhizosphaerae TaxID=3049774 RepID=UPI0025407C7F|nr:ABC transporter ATP-binding protein [Devosia sp. RR2S18]WIJ23701.1 ABC transporter ATP-binding protein [Devosia sp. RR2S18]